MTAAPAAKVKKGELPVRATPTRLRAAKKVLCRKVVLFRLVQGPKTAGTRVLWLGLKCLGAAIPSAVKSPNPGVAGRCGNDPDDRSVFISIGASSLREFGPVA
jgi:hypothetical protein